MTNPTPRTLPQIIDRVLDVAEAEVVDLRTVIASVGRASFTPILLLPSLAVATPLSGIPLFSSLMGIVIVLVSAQMLLRRQHLWLPSWVLRREVRGSSVRRAFARIRPVALWVDRHTAPRFGLFLHRPFIFVPQLICLLSGLVMPVLEFVPFSSSVIGVGVAVMALGMLTRNGLVMLLALAPYAIAGALVARLLI